jgi:hypothetical protein
VRRGAGNHPQQPATHVAVQQPQVPAG